MGVILRCKLATQNSCYILYLVSFMQFIQLLLLIYNKVTKINKAYTR